MVFKIIFHLIAAAQFFYGCYYDYNFVKIPSTSGPDSDGQQSFGGKFKYLTFLNAMLQTAYFTVAVLNDLIGSNDPLPSQNPLIRKLKDLLFSSIAFPLAMFVSTTFWGIYTVDRELILPRRLDAFFPLWLNHIMHTNIAICALVELATSFRMYPKKKVGLSILTFFMLSYLVWIHVVYYHSNHWVYPILDVLNWPVKVVFYVFNLAFVCGLYSLGERLNSHIWPKEVAKTVKSGKKKAK